MENAIKKLENVPWKKKQIQRKLELEKTLFEVTRLHEQKGGITLLKKKQQKSENKTCSVKQGAKSTLNPHTTTLEICQYYVELDENNQK